MSTPRHLPGIIKAFGITILVLCAYFIIQLTLLSAMADNESSGAGFDSTLNDITGLGLIAAIMVSAPLCTILTLLLMKPVRARSIREYIDIHIPSRNAALMWLTITVLAGALYMLALNLLHRPLVNEFMQHIYRTAFSLPLFVLAVAITAPLFEELLFREYLFSRFPDTKAGAALAIALPSLLWAAIHVQYDLFDTGYIFLLGLVLGTARYRTGTVVMPYMMHALNNIISIFIAMNFIDI